MTLLQKVVRFTIIGGLSAVLDGGVFFVLKDIVEIEPMLARAISFILGSTLAYYLNSFFTFDGQRTPREKLRAAISYVLCFSTAVGLVGLIGDRLDGVFPHSEMLAWVVSQGASTILNFLLQNFWVFKTQKPQLPHEGIPEGTQ